MQQTLQRIVNRVHGDAESVPESRTQHPFRCEFRDYNLFVLRKVLWNGLDDGLLYRKIHLNG